MNFDELKKVGVDNIEVLDSLNAPLLQLKVVPITDEALSDKNNIVIYVESNADRKKLEFSLSRPLHVLENIKDEFVLEPEFSGNKVKMKSYVLRRIEETLEEKQISVGTDLSGKELILTFPDVLGSYGNYYPGLFSSEKYRIRETFSNDVNSIILENIESNEVIETLYSNVGSSPATINFTSYVLPDDFGEVVNVVTSESFSEALQYIGYTNINLSLLAEETIEEIKYQPITLLSGYNKITTNYHCDMECVYPKNIEIMRYFLMSSFSYSLNNEDKFLTLDDIYFKDCFTKLDDDLINLLINKLTIKCMNSLNNNFSLDCDGNLIVQGLVSNSITSSHGKFSLDENGNLNVNKITTVEPITVPKPTMDFNAIYPVGSIYLSVNNTNPTSLFGGVWERFASGRTLVGFDSNQTEFNAGQKTGGAKTVTLNVNQMPSHSHPFSLRATTLNGNHGNKTFAGYNANICNIGTMVEFIEGNIPATGGGQSHNNLQPYIVVYMWKRTA